MMLAHRRIDGAPVQAFTKLVGPPGSSFIGGPVLVDSADSRLRHSRCGLPYDGMNPDAPYPQILAGEWNYVGPVYHHFGHVMAEMAHRILPTMHNVDCRNWLAVTHTDGSTAYADLPSAYRSMLDFFEIKPDSLTIINENTIVDRLNIVEQGSDFGGGPKPGYLDMLAAFSHPRLDRLFPDRPFPKKVYVSRSDVPHGGTFLGERYIENLLADEGFYIFHPEQWPLRVQMQYYRSAELLLFPEGSACHGVELLGTGALSRVYVLMRRDNHYGSIGAVLRPRAKQIEVLKGMPYLGTARVGLPDMQLLPELGVSALDLEALVRFLRHNEIAEMASVNDEAYFDSAEADLEAYLQYHFSTGAPVVGQEAIGTICAELKKLRAQTVALPERSTMESTLPKTLLPDLPGEHYIKVLKQIHDVFGPKSYLEIGCFSGDSLALAGCCSIGIDPDLTKSRNVMQNKPFFMGFQMTSDDFYDSYNPAALLGGPIDLAFLDGMHLIEFLLRDFINTEMNCSPASIIVMHDCIPTDAFVGDRINDEVRRPAHRDWWAGDVWKLLPILRQFRPDLNVEAVDAAPTGLVVVSNLDPISTTLRQNYSAILHNWLEVELASYGLEKFIHEAQIVKTADFISSLGLRYRHGRGS